MCFRSVAIPKASAVGTASALEAEQRQVDTDRDAIDAPAEVTSRRYLEKIERLGTGPAAKRDLSHGRAEALFGSLIDRVIVCSVPARAKVGIGIRGYVMSLTKDPSTAPSKRGYGQHW